MDRKDRVTRDRHCRPRLAVTPPGVNSPARDGRGTRLDDRLRTHVPPTPPPRPAVGTARYGHSFVFSIVVSSSRQPGFAVTVGENSLRSCGMILEYESNMSTDINMNCSFDLA